MEKEYKNLSKTAKRGMNKEGSLKLKSMKAYGDLYKKRTGKNPYNVMNKESYYSFVARNRLRKRKK